MKANPETHAARLVLELVLGRTTRLLGAKDYNDAMNQVVDLDVLLRELIAAERAGAQ